MGRPGVSAGDPGVGRPHEVGCFGGEALPKREGKEAAPREGNASAGIGASRRPCEDKREREGQLKSEGQLNGVNYFRGGPEPLFLFEEQRKPPHGSDVGIPGRGRRPGLSPPLAQRASAVVGYVLGLLRVEGWSGADLSHLGPASARLAPRARARRRPRGGLVGLRNASDVTTRERESSLLTTYWSESTLSSPPRPRPETSPERPGSCGTGGGDNLSDFGFLGEEHRQLLLSLPPSLSLAHTLYLSLSLSRSLAHTPTLSLSRSLTHPCTLTRTHALLRGWHLGRERGNNLSDFQDFHLLTHTLSLSLALSPSLSRSHTHSLSLSRSRGWHLGRERGKAILREEHRQLLFVVVPLGRSVQFSI